MQRTQIYLPEKQLKDLHKVAAGYKITVSAVIRLYLEEKLNQVAGKKQVPSIPLSVAAKRIRKMGKGGPKDLASNLDKYLYGEI